jgi:hypothetical protein
MAQILAATLTGLGIAAAVTVFLRRRSKRRRAEDLTLHPERQEQMLDPTDDA